MEGKILSRSIRLFTRYDKSTKTKHCIQYIFNDCVKLSMHFILKMKIYPFLIFFVNNNIFHHTAILSNIYRRFRFSFSVLGSNCMLSTTIPSSALISRDAILELKEKENTLEEEFTPKVLTFFSIHWYYMLPKLS